MTHVFHSEKGVQRAILTMVVVSLVIAAISVAAILGIYLASDSSSRISSTSVPVGPISELGPPISTNATSSSLAPNGLRLTLNLSQTVLEQDNGASMDLSLFNTLTSEDNLTMPAGGGAQFSLGVCSQLPLGLAIFRGDYTATNLSQAPGLNLNFPGFYSCPSGVEIAYWSFAPLSDNITLVSPQSSGPGNATMPESI